MRKKIPTIIDDVKMSQKSGKLGKIEFKRKRTKSISEFDRIDFLILAELLKNLDVRSVEISNKLKIPLSTIQRRRNKIDNSSMLKRRYEIDYKQFGLRRADILVDASKGDCIDIAKEIVKEYPENVLEASIRIGDPKVNLVVEVIYNTSEEIFAMIHYIKKMQHVEDAITILSYLESLIFVSTHPTTVISSFCYYLVCV
jgi:DNA-binding Lrp family transcriptional regulator